MARRLMTWILVLSVGSPLSAPLQAQDPHSAPPGSPGPSWGHGAPHAAAPPHFADQHAPASPYTAPPPPPWVAPPVYDPSGPVPGVGYQGPDGLVTRRIPHDDSWDADGPVERFLMQVGRGAQFRLEYLHWNIRRPGERHVGAPLATVREPRLPFPVFSDLPTPEFIGYGRAPDLTPMDFDGLNGLRASFGMDLNFGRFEISGFKVQRAFEHWTLAEIGDLVVSEEPFEDPFAPPPLGQQMVAVPLLEQGRLSDLVLLFNESYVAAFRSEVWGAAAKMTFDAGMPGEGYKLQPVVSTRLLNVREQLFQTGVFDDPVLLPAFQRTIDSHARNVLVGVMPGLQVVLEHRWFTLGIEPQLGVGLNFMHASVTTERLRTAQDPIVHTSQRRVVLSPMGEVSAFLSVHLTDSFSLLAGYDLLWAGRVSRPHDNILYNDMGLTAAPAVVVQPRFQDYFVHGLTVGGELRFR